MPVVSAGALAQPQLSVTGRGGVHAAYRWGSMRAVPLDHFFGKIEGLTTRGLRLPPGGGYQRTPMPRLLGAVPRSWSGQSWQARSR